MTKFKPVSSQMDFPALERELLEYWYKEGIVEKYLTLNKDSDQKFSFLDGPITANNPMGMHHAWGRMYKDLWQRFWNMKGYAGRFQNGFDEQGLWVEVEVEKELGLRSKKDIENLVPGDKYASLEKFVNLCKERVAKYSAIQTEQSKRLGYFMDWDNSYHTSSDVNNYTIWHFLKTVHDKGWLYKGHDSVPWCPRCGTAISQHEILTEEYKELTHESVFFKLPIIGKDNEFLLVWTTTPWTVPANVSVAVNVEENYVGYKVEDSVLWVMEKRLPELVKNGVLPESTVMIEATKGEKLVGWEYAAPFDGMDRVKNAMTESHRVVAGDPMILPVGTEEGTGLVHVAPGAGTEDFKLGQKEKLPVIDVIDEAAVYLDGLGDLSQQNAKSHPELIFDYLKAHENGKFFHTILKYVHRYPTCWRCKSELVWRVVDEWYIAMDRTDDSGKTYREQMVEVVKKINWLPKWGLDRELDWLKNMHDWLISKKRYWGLALPIWECKDCDTFEVIGGKEDLQEKAVEGWDKFDGHSPHRPWIDEVKVKCPKCGKAMSRIPDVGNPWLDAGIVPFSTLPEEWFPADFITESFPGQFKNWFYSLIAMSTALKGEPSFKNILGFATMVDEHGHPFHKSAGNSIEFSEGADKMGADLIRWMCALQNPENNLLFGYNLVNDVKRRFYLILWNSYKFFVDYATMSGWECELTPSDIRDQLTVLDRWILSRLTETVQTVNKSLEKYDAASAARSIEDFVVNDFSTWYIRRCRDRVGPGAEEKDQIVFLSTSYGVLSVVSKLLAPFMPFISEEMYRNLTGEESVHLTSFPQGDESLLDKKLNQNMGTVRRLVETGHAQRKEAEMKLRQPLQAFSYKAAEQLSADLEKVLAEELNVKEVKYEKGEVGGTIDTKLTPQLEQEGKARDLIRQIQVLRKEAGLTLNDKIKAVVDFVPEDASLKEMVMKQTNTETLESGDQVSIEVIS